ncbi:MAG: hypothetical protein COW13_04200, partial [Candidatus Omnitrophica bacterium CG12_big_fil_rev_8_21_14_0_65_50_5]
GAALMSALGVSGFKDLIVDGRRDHLKSLLEYLDQRLDQPQKRGRLRPTAFQSTYPIFTLLNTIAILGEEDYLTHRRDWVQQARLFYARLTPRAKANQAEYYLMALYNLGLLDQEVADSPDFVRNLVEDYEQFEATQTPQDPLFVNSDDAYIAETAWLFGVSDSVPAWIKLRLINHFREFSPDEKTLTAAWGAAYVFTAMDQLDVADILFMPNSAYDGKTPLGWTIENFSENAENEASSLPLLNHALLSSALRMRGDDKSVTDIFSDFKFLREKRDRDISSRAGKPQLVRSEQRASDLFESFNPSASAAGLGIHSQFDLSNETRAFYSPWSRIVRGMGLGQYPVAYNAEMADHLNAAFDFMQED